MNIITAKSHTQMQRLLAQAHEIVDRMVTRLQFQFEPGVTRDALNNRIHGQFLKFISYSVERGVTIENVSLKPKSDPVMVVSEIARATIAFNEDLTQRPHLLLRINSYYPLLEYTRLDSIEFQEILGSTVVGPILPYNFEKFISSITTVADSAVARIEPRADRSDVPDTQIADALHLKEDRATLSISRHIDRSTVHKFTLTFSA